MIAGTLLATVAAALLLYSPSEVPAAPVTGEQPDQASATVSLTLGSSAFITGTAPNVRTESELVRSTPVLARVQETIRANISSEELLAGLTVAVRPETEIIDITYTASDRATAEEVAVAFADSYIEVRQEQVREAGAEYQAGLTKSIATVREDLNSAESDLTRAALMARLFALENALTDLRLRSQSFDALIPTTPAEGAPIASPSPVATPVATAAPAPTSRKTQLLAAVVLGLLLGISAALVREALDDRIHDPSEIEHAALPLIGPATGPDAERTRASFGAITRTVPGQKVVLLSCGADSRVVAGWDGTIATGSILESADAVTATADTKATALVVKLGSTTGTELRRSVEEVERVGGNVIGALLV